MYIIMDKLSDKNTNNFSSKMIFVIQIQPLKVQKVLLSSLEISNLINEMVQQVIILNNKIDKNKIIIKYKRIIYKMKNNIMDSC